MKRVLAIAFVFMFAFSFSACRQTLSLEGKWKAPIMVMEESVEDNNNYIIVEFNEDGTGSYTRVNYGRQEGYAFTYVVEGECMTVKAYSGSIVYECEYYIDGDELVITTMDQTIVHTRYHGK